MGLGGNDQVLEPITSFENVLESGEKMPSCFCRCWYTLEHRLLVFTDETVHLRGNGQVSCPPKSHLGREPTLTFKLGEK